MSSTAVGSAREEQIDRWVLRSALSLALHNVGVVCEVNDDPEEVENIAEELDADLFNRLWPDPAEPGAVAHARSMALTVSILARLATDDARDYLLKESA